MIEEENNGNESKIYRAPEYGRRHLSHSIICVASSRRCQATPGEETRDEAENNVPQNDATQVSRTQDEFAPLDR